MSEFLTFEELRKPINNYEQRARQSEIFLESNLYSSYIKPTTVFLSHRHSEDVKLINQVRGFFASQGANLYIDWQDKNMPQITSSETAVKLKQRIKLSNKFVILATQKSIESIWIPWKIGLADQIKGLSNIAILPIIHEDEKWEKREYYKLYSRIEKADDDWLVIKPENSYSGQELEKCLKQ